MWGIRKQCSRLCYVVLYNTGPLFTVRYSSDTCWSGHQKRLTWVLFQEPLFVASTGTLDHGLSVVSWYVTRSVSLVTSDRLRCYYHSRLLLRCLQTAVVWHTVEINSCFVAQVLPVVTGSSGLFYTFCLTLGSGGSLLLTPYHRWSAPTH